MKSFEQHPDGRVYIRAGDKLYLDTRENFEVDYGDKLAPLPDGVIERHYVQGVRHALNGEDGSTVAGGERVFALGDFLIEHIDDLLVKQTARRKAAFAALTGYVPVETSSQEKEGTDGKIA